MVEIAGRPVGPGHPCFVVAEGGVNHNGDVELGRQLVEAAARAGADAVKFQTFVADRLATPAAPKAGYQVETTGAAESQQAMLRRLELSSAAHHELSARCAREGILFLSSSFDEESADFLEELGVAAFKVASGELTNLPLLAHIARKRRPMILSTGMASMDEVATAVRIVHNAGGSDLVLLHCVSAYPANPQHANLRAMRTMADAFDVPVGYSDHTLGADVALAAVALGACVLEKHFTLDRRLPGPDHRMSLDPAELAALVRSVRTIEAALGHGRKEPAPGEAEVAAVVRRSLVAARDLAAGTLLTEDVISIRRPGTGLAPALRSRLAGRRLKIDVPAGTLLTFEMLA